MAQPSPGFDPANFAAFLEGLRIDVGSDGRPTITTGSPIADIWRRAEPQLRPIPATTRGFRIRVDLQHAKPPVWRRIEVAGSMLLPQLHHVLQAAMGWTDSHLHRFRTGDGRDAPELLTRFDLAEGDVGMLEDDVRLDQLVGDVGDRLWYDYDFGDGWEHVLRVERVLDAPPARAVCTDGRLACPPEDCGGVHGYSALAAWVRNGYDDAHRPDVFATTEDGRGWLPADWHPDDFDIELTNTLIAAETAEPIPVTDELATVVERERSFGTRSLHAALSHPAAHSTFEVDAAAAARATEPFRVLLDVIGDGVPLTGAGYLKPAAVEQIAERTGITTWWIGKANREDLTWPVAELRGAARSLGLVTTRGGSLRPTRAAQRCMADPQALLDHIVGRLPLGRHEAERHAGWAALATAGSDTPAERWHAAISAMLFGLGWRDGANGYDAPHAESATLDVLQLLAGGARERGSHGVDATVAEVARRAMRA